MKGGEGIPQGLGDGSPLWMMSLYARVHTYSHMHTCLHGTHIALLVVDHGREGLWKFLNILSEHLSRHGALQFAKSFPFITVLETPVGQHSCLLPCRRSVRADGRSLVLSVSIY